MFHRESFDELIKGTAMLLLLTHLRAGETEAQKGQGVVEVGEELYQVLRHSAPGLSVGICSVWDSITRQALQHPTISAGASLASLWAGCATGEGEGLYVPLVQSRPPWDRGGLSLAGRWHFSSA